MACLQQNSLETRSARWTGETDMANNISNRQAVCDTLLALAKKDKSIVVLTSDSRGSAGLAPFAEAYPSQHVETGIAEQNIVGIAAGLAASGKKPVVASPASFLSMRSIEQVKVDVAYSANPVLLLGISGGLSYGALGMTHHSLQDIAVMRAIPGLDVILPADRFETADVIKDLIANPRPAYVRIGRNAVEDVFGEGIPTEYRPGKATMLSEGLDAAVIATGELAGPAKETARLLEAEGVQVMVLDMHTLKPFDEQAVLMAAKTGFIVTMEEHSVYGGLGSAVAQVVSGRHPVPVQVLAIPDEPAVAGNSAEVFAHYGLTAKNAADIIRGHLRKN